MYTVYDMGREQDPILPAARVEDPLPTAATQRRGERSGGGTRRRTSLLRRQAARCGCERERKGGEREKHSEGRRLGGRWARGPVSTGFEENFGSGC